MTKIAVLMTFFATSELIHPLTEQEHRILQIVGNGDYSISHATSTGINFPFSPENTIIFGQSSRDDCADYFLNIGDDIDLELQGGVRIAAMLMVASQLNRTQKFVLVDAWPSFLKWGSGSWRDLKIKESGKGFIVSGGSDGISYESAMELLISNPVSVAQRSFNMGICGQICEYVWSNDLNPYPCDINNNAALHNDASEDSRTYEYASSTENLVIREWGASPINLSYPVANLQVPDETSGGYDMTFLLYHVPSMKLHWAVSNTPISSELVETFKNVSTANMPNACYERAWCATANQVEAQQLIKVIESFGHIPNNPLLSRLCPVRCGRQSPSRIIQAKEQDEFDAVTEMYTDENGCVCTKKFTTETFKKTVSSAAMQGGVITAMAMSVMNRFDWSGIGAAEFDPDLLLSW